MIDRIDIIKLSRNSSGNHWCVQVTLTHYYILGLKRRGNKVHNFYYLSESTDTIVKYYSIQVKVVKTDFYFRLKKKKKKSTEVLAFKRTLVSKVHFLAGNMQALMKFLISNLDIIFLTWQKHGLNTLFYTHFVLNESSPPHFRYFSVPRLNKKGGRVACLFRNTLCCQQYFSTHMNILFY